MRTQEQDVVAERAQLAALKTTFLTALDQYVRAKTGRSVDLDAVILSVQRAGNSYFNHAEEFVGNSDLLGAHSSALWVQGFAEDCCQILAMVPAYIELLRIASRESEALSSLPFEPASTAYANMQRMVMRHLSKEVAIDLREDFERANLPIYGFKNKAIRQMNIEKILAFIFGVVFVCVLLIVAIFQPTPTSFQAGVFRTVLALAAAGVAAVIPGFLHVQYRNWLRAGGAIAVFIIVYFYGPAIT